MVGATKKIGINPIWQDLGNSRICHDLYPDNALSVVVGKAQHRIGFDIETTGIWLFVSSKFPSWEMSGNFMEKSGK